MGNKRNKETPFIKEELSHGDREKEIRAKAIRDGFIKQTKDRIQEIMAAMKVCTSEAEYSYHEADLRNEQRQLTKAQNGESI